MTELENLVDCVIAVHHLMYKVQASDDVLDTGDLFEGLWPHLKLVELVSKWKQSIEFFIHPEHSWGKGMKKYQIDDMLSSISRNLMVIHSFNTWNKHWEDLTALAFELRDLREGKILKIKLRSSYHCRVGLKPRPSGRSF